MARYTDRWGLSILGSGDSLQDEGFKFTDADRRLIDRILKWAAEEHHHDGATGSDSTPAAGLSLSLQTTGGTLTGGTRYYYCYTIIDADGNETAPSPVQSIDTPSAIRPPLAGAPSHIAGSGALTPGTYLYAFSAYVGANTVETKVVHSIAIKVSGTNPSNSVSIVLPDLPAGASGFNVYRRAPNGMYFLYLESIAAPTPGQSWLDDGSTSPTVNRSLPARNTTLGTNSVDISYPGATPSLPGGWSWRIYRTETADDWGRSYLTEIVPAGSPPVTPVTYTDVGTATGVGGPPPVAQWFNSPAKISFTDAAEVQGSLPPGLAVTPQMLTFSAVGPVIVREGSFTWVCDYEKADIIHVRAYLASGSVPAAQDVIVDVNAYRQSQATPAWQSIFAGGTRPTVPVGDSIGAISIPTIKHLEEGDALTVDVDQSGGGATPTDQDLTVNILLYVKAGSETTSYDW